MSKWKAIENYYFYDTFYHRYDDYWWSAWGIPAENKNLQQTIYRVAKNKKWRKKRHFSL